MGKIDRGEGMGMNKKLDRLVGQEVAEKRGKGWALATFLREAWGLSKEEMLANVA